MTEPTDAEQATATEIWHRWKMGATTDTRALVSAYATALATARAESWRAGVEAAARFIIVWCQDDAAFVIQDRDAKALADAVHALAGPGEPEAAHHRLCPCACQRHLSGHGTSCSKHRDHSRCTCPGPGEREGDHGEG